MCQAVRICNTNTKDVFVSALVATWRSGIPISQEFTLVSNLREHRHSLVDYLVGATLTNMIVFAPPPRHGCTHTRKCVFVCGCPTQPLYGHIFSMYQECSCNEYVQLLQYTRILSHCFRYGTACLRLSHRIGVFDTARVGRAIWHSDCPGHVMRVSCQF